MLDLHQTRWIHSTLMFSKILKQIMRKRPLSLSLCCDSHCLSYLNCAIFANLIKGEKYEHESFNPHLQQKNPTLSSFPAQDVYSCLILTKHF